MMNQKSSMVIRNIALLFLVFSIAISVLGCSINSPFFDKTSKLESLVSSGEYEEALNYYKENRTDISKKDATDCFMQALDKMYQDYLAGTIESEDIIDYVSNLERVNSDSLDSYGQNILLDVEKIEEMYVDNGRVVTNSIDKALSTLSPKEIEELLKGFEKKPQTITLGGDEDEEEVEITEPEIPATLQDQNAPIRGSR